MGLFRSPSSLLAIARPASADDVLPRCLSPLAAGKDVIEGRLFGG